MSRGNSWLRKHTPEEQKAIRKRYRERYLEKLRLERPEAYKRRLERIRVRAREYNRARYQEALADPVRRARLRQKQAEHREKLRKRLAENPELHAQYNQYHVKSQQKARQDPEKRARLNRTARESHRRAMDDPVRRERIRQCRRRSFAKLRQDPVKWDRHLAKTRERSKDYWRKIRSDPARHAARLAYDMRDRENLVAAYVRKALCNNTALRHGDIPPLLVEVKRLEMSFKRKLKTLVA